MSDKSIFINGRFLTQKITGVQRNAYELTKNLLVHNQKIVVLVPGEKLNPGYDIDGWPLYTFGRLKGVMWEQVELPFYLYRRGGSPLLINLTNTAPIVYSNQVVSIMDMTTFINPAWFDKKFARYYQWLVPKIARNSKVVFTISDNSKKDIVRFTGVSEAKIKIIHCGISDIFTSFTPGCSNVIDKLGLKQQGYLLAVSSLDPRKNFGRLIEAFLKMDIEIPLVIVGSKGKAFGDMKLSQEQLNSDRIIFTDYINDRELKSLYKYALCFIYPSLYEGFGIPPLEAMANGCPTIVSQTSSLPEVCGNASFYIDPISQESIIAAIKQITVDIGLREELTKRGLENVKRFNWQSSALKALEEIHSIA